MENFNAKKQLLDNWNKEKLQSHFRKKYPIIKAGQIWWCRMGENIGVEINGKHELFTRPVYILKKLSEKGALIIPITSKRKSGPWYFPFIFKNRRECAVLSQIRTISTLRLESIIGTLAKNTQDSLRDKLFNFLSYKILNRNG